MDNNNHLRLEGADQIKQLAHDLIEAALTNVRHGFTDEKLFVVLHYDYFLLDYPDLDSSEEDFNKRLYEAIMTDSIVRECDIGNIEHSTVEILFKDDVV